MKIQRGIFKVDALAPLLFVLAMMPLNHIFRNAQEDTNFTNRKKKLNYVKARIDKTQQNNRCSDRDETINHIMNERSKLAQKSIRLVSEEGDQVGIVQEV